MVVVVNGIPEISRNKKADSQKKKVLFWCKYCIYFYMHSVKKLLI